MTRFAGLEQYPQTPAPPVGLAALADADRVHRWQLDFHYPRGVVPLAHELVQRGVVRASATAASQVGGIGTGGLDCRAVGGMVYTTGLPPADPAATRFDRRYADEFGADWRRRRDAIVTALRPGETLEPTRLTATELGAAYRNAVEAFELAWTTHFEVMYRLLAIHNDFQEVCHDIGLDPDTIVSALPVRPSRMNDANAALRGLAARASSELADEFARRRGRDLLDALGRSESGRQWLMAFSAFLIEFGHRADSVVDLDAASWLERPTIPLDLITEMVRSECPEPIPPTPTPLSSLLDDLTPERAARFDAALAVVQRADFTWWNEEHNFYIDQRAHLPVRRIGLEVGRRCLHSPRAGLMLFGPELEALCDGAEASQYDALVMERERIHEASLAGRAQLPAVFGTEESRDPVMEQMYGLHVQSDAAEDAPASTVRVLRGVGVVPGTVRGRARVIQDAGDVRRVGGDEILVCRGSTPGWTAGLGTIGACVSEFGGPLSHTAIACRDRGIVGVVGVPGVTTAITDGDLIEVDGTRGRVVVLPD